ncbi:hypothetical protein [Natrinema altunense]|uniref:Uncharacterized protein n=1 Tax=Natrinema altunense TaxID=222984 RepID=A0A482XV24_9EURY|nr:hypothetical protein [Natrinema altunense]RZH67199.1 hypothetical protein ELS17_15760 [Natrinema altunense]
MPFGFLYYVTNQLDTIFTGLTMAVIGITIYEARDGFFLARGKFRGKYEALVIFLGVLVGSSFLTPVINDVWAAVLPDIHPGQLIGSILILGMVGVNKAAEWNYIDPKSAIVYFIGLVLVLNPDILFII